MIAARPESIKPVTLLDLQNDAPVDAELWTPITDKNLADWEAEWVPALFERIRALNQRGVERRLWPQSRLWDWREKLAAIEGRLSNLSYAIVQGGLTQAMMIVDVTKRAKLGTQRNDHLVYIDFVETAPWNRGELSELPPRFSGCGSVLLATAIQQSSREGFKGRIGLHSLPQSNDFYANHCGFQDLGSDPQYQNLRYFEATPEIAQQFLEKGNQR